MAISGKTLFLSRFSLLLALEAIVCFTPLGSIPFTPLIVATLGMVPVIITAIVMGTKAGTAMGAFAGLFSLLVMTFTPVGGITAFVFTPFYSVGDVHGNGWSLVICFVPRILVGVVSGLVYSALKNRLPGGKHFLAYGISAAAGSLINTFGVLGGIYLFFGRDYAAVVGKPYELLIGLIGTAVLTNGVPEAIVSVILAAAICPPLRKLTAG